MVEGNCIKVESVRRHNPQIFPAPLCSIVEPYLASFHPRAHQTGVDLGIFSKLSESEVRRVSSLSETLHFSNGEHSLPMQRAVYWDMHSRCGESVSFYVDASLTKDDQFLQVSGLALSRE